jgi:hypothetical protein
MNTKRFFSIFSVVMILCLLTVGLNGQSVQAQSTVSGELANVVITPAEITWTPLEAYARLYVRVAKPDGEVFDLVFEADQTPLLGLQDPDGNPLVDGLYRYELVAMPELDAETLAILAQVTQEDRDQTVAELKQAGKLPEQSLTQTGAFYINNGAYAMAAVEGEAASEVQSAQSIDDEPLDVVHLDDEIVSGSLCVGIDCLIDGSEGFGSDTIKLKENNLRIYFDDTSSSAGFPANDWRLIANDSTSGGSNYFSIEDSTAGRRVFTVEAGAPANSLFIEDYGRVGLGTSVPVLELSIKDSDTPSIRLEQDFSGGWTPQTFDIGANESNFFIRDATNGSKMPFRIQPNAPSNSLTIRSSGYVGIGTWSPTEMLHVAGNVRVDGYIVEFSDVNVKMGFLPVDGAEILQKLLDMPVTTWSYKAEGSDVIHMGPTAQDFYAAFGLGDDDKHIAALDTNGVALAAIQELTRLSQAQDARITALEQQNADLEERVEALEKLVTELVEAQK